MLLLCNSRGKSVAFMQLFVKNWGIVQLRKLPFLHGGCFYATFYPKNPQKRPIFGQKFKQVEPPLFNIEKKIII